MVVGNTFVLIFVSLNLNQIQMDYIQEKIKKTIVPKGFLSSCDRPTQRAVEMFFVYLSNLPEGWDIKQLNKNSIEKVRDYFGVDYGFGTMIMWGVRIECAKSNSSKGRYEAMSTAFTIARGMIGQKVKLTTKKIPQSQYLNAA